MWAAIALSLALFVLLAGLGWGDTAASLAGGLLLLLACGAVCIWAAVQGRTAESEVDRAVGQIGCRSVAPTALVPDRATWLSMEGSPSNDKLS